MFMPRSMVLLVGAVFGTFLFGCGTKYQPVTGEIVFPDGTPAKGLAGGTIAFQRVGSESEGPAAEGTNPSSPIDSEGKFKLGTMQPNDGAIEGEYMYVIAPPQSSGDEQIPKVIADKHTKLDDTKRFTVKKGANHFKIEVEPFE